jgi:nitroreductase
MSTVVNSSRWRQLLRAFPHSRVLRHLYALISRAFDGEIAKILAGQLAFFDERERAGRVSDLRRTVHRLEKALSLRGGAPAVDDDLVRLTVGKLGLALTVAPDDDSSVRWAVRTLRQFFVESGGRPEDAYSAFEELMAEAGDRGRRENSVVSGPEPRSATYDHLLRLVVNRHSVRSFEGQPVPHELVDAAVEVARHAPSACNRQAFQFQVLDDRRRVEAVLRVPGGAGEYAANVPTVLVVVGDYAAYQHDRDRHLIFIDASLASMALILALESLGIASCCVNFPALPDREQKMADLLGLSATQQVVMLIAAGYPKTGAVSPSSAKKSVVELREYVT